MDITSHLSEIGHRDWQTNSHVPTTRLAVVGLGWWAQEYAIPAIVASEFCTPTVFVSGSPDIAAGLTKKYDVETVIDYTEFSRGKARGEYDAVYVVTPNSMHAEHAVAAAEMGKDVIVEKPLESSVAAADRLVATCENEDVLLMTAYRIQFDPVIRRLRKMIQDGVIGDPVTFHGGFSFHLVGGLPGQWRRDAAVSGGGSLTDIGVYPLNTTRFLLGTDPLEIRGDVSNPDAEFADARDEHAWFQLSFPNDVTASFHSSFNEYGTNWLQIHGTDGRIKLEPAFDAAQPRVMTIDGDEEEITYRGPKSNEVREMFDYFAHSRDEGEISAADGRDGLTDMRIMEAVYRSAETGKAISLD